MDNKWQMKSQKMTIGKGFRIGKSEKVNASPCQVSSGRNQERGETEKERKIPGAQSVQRERRP